MRYEKAEKDLGPQVCLPITLKVSSKTVLSSLDLQLGAHRGLISTRLGCVQNSPKQRLEISTRRTKINSSMTRIRIMHCEKMKLNFNCH